MSSSNQMKVKNPNIDIELLIEYNYIYHMSWFNYVKTYMIYDY